MTFATLDIQGPVGLLRLKREDRLNAISATLANDLLAAVEAAVADPDLAVLILCGEGRAFCAGNDLKELDALAADRPTAERFIDSIQRISRLLMNCDKIVIGAAQGYAVGGGFEWLLNCDLVIASEDLVAFFPEMALGQFVTGGVTWLLPRAVGRQPAMRLLLLGERHSADKLQAMGLVSWVVPREALMPRALEVAAAVCAQSRRSVVDLKQVVTADDFDALDRALDREKRATVDALLRDDAKTRLSGRFES